MFCDKAKKAEDNEAEIKDLHAKIGKLAVENDFLSQGLNAVARQRMYLHELPDEFQAKRVIDEWLDFYNAERPHTTLVKQTPENA